MIGHVITNPAPPVWQMLAERRRAEWWELDLQRRRPRPGAEAG